jgi:hypothetical protein
MHILLGQMLCGALEIELGMTVFAQIFFNKTRSRAIRFSVCCEKRARDRLCSLDLRFWKIVFLRF